MLSLYVYGWAFILGRGGVDAANAEFEPHLHRYDWAKNSEYCATHCPVEFLNLRFRNAKPQTRGFRNREENSMAGIKDKVVVVTGASSGIGEATAVLLAEKGAKLVLGARGVDRLKTLADRIRQSSGEVAYAVTDVRKRADLSALVGLASEKFGKLDVIFNNAGVMPVSPLKDLRVDDWDEMIDVNIKGVLYGVAAALPVFRAQGFGHFVNTASTAAHKTVPNQSVYSGTKYAVRAISEGLRQEVAEEKLRVTIISPGFTRTNFADRVTNSEVKAQLAASRDKFAMSPDAIARAVAYAIEQPADVDVAEIIVRSTAQA